MAFIGTRLVWAPSLFSRCARPRVHLQLPSGLLETHHPERQRRQRHEGKWCLACRASARQPLHKAQSGVLSNHTPSCTQHDRASSPHAHASSRPLFARYFCVPRVPLSSRRTAKHRGEAAAAKSGVCVEQLEASVRQRFKYGFCSTGVGFSSRVESEGSQGSCPLSPQRSGICRLSAPTPEVCYCDPPIHQK